MIILILTISALTFWSLRLMQRAVNQREFSLMFAGALVAIAGAGIIAAYSLMVGCVGYIGHSAYATLPPSLTTAYTEETWIPFTDSKEDAGDFVDPMHSVSFGRRIIE
jgi:ABC-type lipoprotein release transport system permease subunit